MSLISSPAASFLEWVVLEYTGRESPLPGKSLGDKKGAKSPLIILKVSGKINLEEPRRET